MEEHSKDIAIYYSLNGRHLTNISTESVPLAIDFAKETSTLYASCSNLQIYNKARIFNFWLTTELGRELLLHLNVYEPV